MNIEVGLIVVVCFIAVLVVCLAVLRAAESRIAAERARLRAPRESERGRELVCDEVYIRIKDGRAGVFYALPEAEKEPVSAPQPEEPVIVEAYDELAVSSEAEEDPEKREQIEKLAERFGGQITENSRIIEVAPPESSAFAERFAALDLPERMRCNEFTAYLLSKPDMKMLPSKTGITFKYKTERILRIVIRRKIPIVLFQLANTDLKRFVKEEEVKTIKISTVDIRLASEEELAVAKQTADIAVENAEEDLAYRRERSRELRRLRAQERRKAEKQSAK